MIIYLDKIWLLHLLCFIHSKCGSRVLLDLLSFVFIMIKKVSRLNYSNYNETLKMCTFVILFYC